MSSIFRLILDPTGIFCLACLTLPPTLEYLKHPQNLEAILKGYLLDPAILAGFTLLLLVYFGSGSVKDRKTFSPLLANWFLWNGAIIHVTMDGLTGGYHFLPLLDKHYRKIDKRFDTDEAYSWVITQVELFIEAPLCFLTYRALVKKHPSRYILVILTCFTQWAGAVVFFFPEILSNFPNTPVDRHFKFDFDSILYFWFAFGANLIWMIIPYFLMENASSHLSRAQATHDALNEKAHQTQQQPKTAHEGSEEEKKTSSKQREKRKKRTQCSKIITFR